MERWAVLTGEKIDDICGWLIIGIWNITCVKSALFFPNTPLPLKTEKNLRISHKYLTWRIDFHLFFSSQKERLSANQRKKNIVWLQRNHPSILSIINFTLIKFHRSYRLPKLVDKITLNLEIILSCKQICPGVVFVIDQEFFLMPLL